MNVQDFVKAKEALTTPVGRTSPPQCQSSTAMLRLFRADTFDFALRDQAVAVGHTGSARCSTRSSFGVRLLCVTVTAYQQGRRGVVDLTLKMNVLAVCVVFVFIGAIVLGAF
jgi:hypothetical protein